MTNTVAYFYYRLYFCNNLPESFIEMEKFLVTEKHLMQQLFNWQLLNSIFISPLISYSFELKKLKPICILFPLCSIPI